MPETPPAAWYLEGFAGDGREIWRTAVRRLPFSIGRGAECDLVLPTPRVSMVHADLRRRQGMLWLRDRESTNGTFLNGERVLGERALNDGDVLHFADQEFRLVAAATGPSVLTTQTMALGNVAPEYHIFERQRQLRALLDGGGLETWLEPMVRLADGAVVAFEAHGRGHLAREDVPAEELFEIAATLGAERELSRSLRVRGVADSSRLDPDAALFLAAHSAELEHRAELLESLRELRRVDASRPLVLEIHEHGMNDLPALRALRDDLQALQVGISFDGFGTGQMRLLELIEASPQYVRFDRTWIQDLDRASRRRLEMVETLVNLVAEWDVAAIAEGVERPEQAAVCKNLGFEIGQGRLFRPGQ